MTRGDWSESEVMPRIYSRMKGSVPCRCDRGERQREEDAHAALVLKQPKKVGHLPSCPIVQAHRLNQVRDQLNRLESQPTFAEPIMEALGSERRADLEAEERKLANRLRAVGVDVTTTSEVTSTA